MKLSIDFNNNEVVYDNEGSKGSIFVDDLAAKQEEILKILGIAVLPMEELRNDIDNLFKELGLNVTCAKEK